MTPTQIHEKCFDAKISLSNLEQLQRGSHSHPHLLLGLHQLKDSAIIRLWRPGASEGEIFGLIKGQRVCFDLGPPGLFYRLVSKDLKVDDYRIMCPGGLITRDPFSFDQILTADDLERFSRGVHYELDSKLGARLTHADHCAGASFAVWAPNAQGVTLVGDFNQWHETMHPMRRLPKSGVWELFVPNLAAGQRYKFRLTTQNGELCFKADPFALKAQLRPESASVLARIDESLWSDAKWLDERLAKGKASCPMAIYEVHLGSWRRNDDGSAMNYRQIAPLLANYTYEMGFTHIELLPITEYPLDESWGYQVGGYFAVTSRYGSLDDFQYFVNCFHERGIGIILDWVPGHFVSDDFGLARFDGTALYEHFDEHREIHPHWGTKIFDHGRKEVSNFLIASALFWARQWHLDGLRVDAVASMLYLDYGKEGLFWSPNRHGGHENLEAIEFIKHLNSIMIERAPGVLMIAEESTAWWGVTAALHEGGLGFHLKWNMGWMNDTLTYFARDSVYRSFHQQELTFAQHYAFTEKFALVLSHDEVVHGKRSILEKMPGDLWRKFAHVRLLYSYMICQPGKKLLFMGGEFGVLNEWDSAVSLNWSLLNQPLHRGLQTLVRHLNHLYSRSRSLWSRDEDPAGFSWIDFSDTYNCAISYFRQDRCERLICLHNFTPNCVTDYCLHIDGVEAIEEIFNTDALEYGGSGMGNCTCTLHRGADGAFTLVMPPLATLIFRAVTSKQTI